MDRMKEKEGKVKESAVA